MPRSKAKNYANDRTRMGIVQERCGYKPLPIDTFSDADRALKRFLLDRDAGYQAASKASTARNLKIQARKRGDISR